MSLDFLDAFKFIKKDTFLHKLDPRSKLLLSIEYTIFGFIFTEIAPLLIILFTLIPLIINGRIFKKWIISMKSLSFLFIIIILLNTFFLSLSFSIGMIIRIIIMVSAFSIFFLSVDPNDLALSLLSMKVPYSISFSFSLAFRFVPTIAIETENIKDAQQSRGYELQTTGLVNKIKNLFPLLVPLIICSIKRAFNVAEALESRAFGSNKKRTYYYTINYSLKDWLFTLYLLILLIIVFFIRINLHLFTFLNWSIPL
ncbi:MAG: energy-coupling factor transporter transmembrane component T family protein [Promethearchaeota archaeon]